MTETKSLSQIFQESVTDLQGAFPEKLDKLVILIDTSATPVYISPDIAEELSGNTYAIKEALEYAFPHDRSDRTGLSNPNYNMDATFVRLIALKEHPASIGSPRYTEEMHSLTSFDHEMGHLVVKNGCNGNHLAECAADAYAALRHIQRFGRETDFFKYHTLSRSIILGRDLVHYTDATVQKVKQLSEEMDISGLSLHETAKLAGEIALQCQINRSTLKKITAAFVPAKEAYNRGSDEACYRAVLSVMKEHSNDPDIFEAGKRFLSYPSITKFIEESAKTDAYWKDAIDFIAQPVPVKKDGWFKRLLHPSHG